MNLTEKWKTYISGDAFHDEALKQVSVYQQTMLYDRELLWADVPFSDNASDILFIVERLNCMAVALNSPTAQCYMDNSLSQQVIYGLEWLYKNRYNESGPPYGNWWYWEIGVPIALLETIILMEGQLHQELMDRLFLPVSKYVGDPAFHARWFVTTAPPSTGANLVWKITAVALMAAIQGDEQMLIAARNGLLPLFRNTVAGDGFYADGSFIQHDRYAYTGGYGVSLLHDLVRLMVWLHDSPWELPSEANHLVAHWIEQSFAPLMFRGLLMDTVSGREISRSGSQNHESGHSVITSCLRFSRIIEESLQVDLLSRVKGWIVMDTYKSYVSEAPPDVVKQAKALLDNNQLQPASEATFCKVFAAMDRAVLQGSGFAFSVSMFSSRMYSYESINKENLKGWYTSYGMTHLYNNDLGQYADAYWPTVDPYRMSGTTVTNKQRLDGAGQGRLSSKSFVGGAVLHGKYGAIAMELEDMIDEAPNKLTALKSWFLFGDRIIAVGSNIKSYDSTKVETIIENRRLNQFGDNKVTADGDPVCKDYGIVETLRTKWIHMTGSAEKADIGIIFPEKCIVHGLRQRRQGSWQDINAFGSPEIVERVYQTLWFDHGEAPKGDSYVYVLLPGYSEEATACFAEKSCLQILELNERVHAVEDSELGLFAVHFWKPSWYTCGVITCSGQLSIVLHRNFKGWSLALADPTQMQREPIEIQIQMSFTQVIHRSERISIKHCGLSKVSLIFDPADAAGRSFYLEVE